MKWQRTADGTAVAVLYGPGWSESGPVLGPDFQTLDSDMFGTIYSLEQLKHYTVYPIQPIGIRWSSTEWFRTAMCVHLVVDYKSPLGALVLLKPEPLQFKA